MMHTHWPLFAAMSHACNHARPANNLGTGRGGCGGSSYGCGGLQARPRRTVCSCCSLKMAHSCRILYYRARCQTLCMEPVPDLATHLGIGRGGCGSGRCGFGGLQPRQANGGGDQLISECRALALQRFHLRGIRVSYQLTDRRTGSLQTAVTISRPFVRGGPQRYSLMYG
jgi:hypothetical protein